MSAKTVHLSFDILRAATIGVLICEGHDEEKVAADIERFGLDRHAPSYVQEAVRKVASVALTFASHGIINHNEEAAE
jgi:hypothetical protein